MSDEVLTRLVSNNMLIIEELHHKIIELKEELVNFENDFLIGQQEEINKIPIIEKVLQDLMIAMKFKNQSKIMCDVINKGLEKLEG